jgi:hypothetical protein
MRSLQGVPIASGQKTTLRQCGIGLSQRAKAFAMEFPAGRVATIVGARGERVGILLSEVDLPRWGVLDPHIMNIRMLTYNLTPAPAAPAQTK